jgi:hypothetical protein
VPIDASAPADGGGPDGASTDSGSSADSGSTDAGSANDAGPDGDEDAGGNVEPGTTPVLGNALGAVAPIEFGVVDAEYSRQLEMLVMVSDVPSALVLFDVEEDTLYAVPLATSGVCVSISPDGTRAAVGYLGGVVLVDLVGRTVLRTYPLTEAGAPLDVFDVVLAGNGYAYLSPRRQTWTSLFALELSDGELHPSTGMQLYGGARIDLHPGGAAVYSADNGISPSDIQRWNIAGGPAVFDHDSPYHGTHGACGYVAVTEDGGRMISGCGAVYAASDDPARDLLYRGALEMPVLPAWLSLQWHADHSSAAHRVALLRAENPVQSDRLLLFEDEYLRAEQSIVLPTTLAGGVQVPVRGSFVFFTQSGARVVLVVRYQAPGETAFRHGLIALEPAAGGNVVAPPDAMPLMSRSGVDFLDLWVVDAEYSDVLDRIVLVTREPSALVILDPGSLQRTTLALPLRPRTVSIGPDGLHAAVGHNAWISTVDLTVPAITDVVEVSAPLYDVVLADNGYAYGFPSRDQWVDLHSVSLADGVETLLYPVREATVGALHPDGDRLYAGSTSIPFARYDISSGPAVEEMLSDEPVEGGLCYDVAFSDDGERIFGGCGTVFHSSAAAASDLRYAGRLERAPEIAFQLGALDYSGDAGSSGMVATVERTANSPEQYESVGFYPEPYLTQYATRALPPLQRAGSPVRVDGRFLFYSSDGSLVHVLVEGAATGVTRRFGLTTFDVPSAEDPPAAPQPPFAVDYAGFDVLDYRVSAAAYSDELDRLLLVAEDPPALHVINPVARTDTAVPLPLRGNAVSVSAAGDVAAVGHDGWVSVVDLSPPALVDTQRISTRVTELALSDVDTVFAARYSNGFALLHTLDLDTSTELTSPQLLFGVLSIVLRSSTTLYVYDGSISRYDVSSGEPVFEGTKRFAVGTLCDLLELTDDGRLVTGCGYMLSTAPAFANDVVLGGQFENASRYRSIDHASASGVFVSLPQGDGTAVHVHDDTSLLEQAVLPLPTFRVGPQTHPAYGRHVFIDSDGNTAYVIVQASPTPALARDFAVVTVAVP